MSTEKSSTPYHQHVETLDNTQVARLDRVLFLIVTSNSGENTTTARRPSSPSIPIPSDMNSLSLLLSCNWTGCEEMKIFGRKSDFKGQSFIIAMYGKNMAESVTSACSQHVPRQNRGFPRKRNLDTHIAPRHQKSRRTSAVPTRYPASSEPVDKVSNVNFNTLNPTTQIHGELGTLETELRDLEVRKKALVEDQAAVDADIEAVKRINHLISTRKQ